MVEESESEKVNKTATILDNTTSSKKPKRKKQFYQRIKNQMEFYFSDVNITKDRYMSQVLEESPYVDLSVFMNFNRIKAITTNIKDIASALKTSELLKVTDCGTKVYRVTPLKTKENSEDCTIYVEQLPLHADHDWLIDVFQAYGPVDYVSIPKFRFSRKNKGFAFVEFKEAQSAERALSAFSEMGCCLSDQMDPRNLWSIKTFVENDTDIADKQTYTGEKEKSEVDNFERNKCGTTIEDSSDQSRSNKSAVISRKRKKSNSKSDDSISDCKKKNRNSDSETENNSVEKNRLATEEGAHSSNETDMNKSLTSEVDTTCSKKKRKSSESSKDNENTPTKIPKLESTDVLCNPENNESKDVSYANMRCSETSCDENVNNETEEDVKNDEERKNKTRRKRKKNKRNKGGDNTRGLQILSKLHWKRLRNKYLDEQRNEMKLFKEYVKSYKDPNREGRTVKDENVKSEDGSVVVSNRLTLVTGHIVKVILDEPIMSASSFKNEAKMFPEIKYIDATAGTNIAFIRFGTTTAAEDCVKSGHWKKAEIIKGEEESSYWNKVVVDREQKCSKPRPLRKGRDKLLRKAEKIRGQHLRFD